MQLSGSIILRNLCFLQLEGSLLNSLLSPFLCFNHNAGIGKFQDGMLYKK